MQGVAEPSLRRRQPPIATEPVEKIEWVPPASYRRWRDVGIRGYTPHGLPNVDFRGRWAARNALFRDVMVRTGLRLSEQTALTVFEMPLDRGLGGYQRFWLPASIAKGGSARWVYVPESLVGEAITYSLIDRPDVIKEAQAVGRYRRWPRPFIVVDPERPVARSPDGSRIKVAHLDRGSSMTSPTTSSPPPNNGRQPTPRSEARSSTTTPPSSKT